MRKSSSAVALLIGCGFAATTTAEDYDYGVGLRYGMGTFDSTSIPIVNGVPMPTLGRSTSSSDADNIDLIGAWYYSGLSDSNGPKSRAAFLSRASSFVLGYSRSDESGSVESTGGIVPPFTASKRHQYEYAFGRPAPYLA